MAKHGIDISTYQGHNVDFNKVKAAGVDFVILRAGYGKYISQKDPTFEGNYARAKAAGLNVGVYWYSYAQTEADAKLEAQVCLQAIAGKQFEYPIFFDLEERSQFNKGAVFCSKITEIFCGELEKAGYFAGLYISRSPLQQYISANTAKKYTLWIAEYATNCNYGGTYGMWQNSSTWRVNGVNGNVDHDYSYVDYSKIIKEGGFNGFKKPATTEVKAEVKTSNAAKPVDTKPAGIKSEYERGDVNGDGKIDVSDITAIAAHIKGKKPLEK